MKTQAFRLSFWLMPAYPNQSDAFDSNARNGVEIDIFEYDPVAKFNNTLLMKVAGGDAGNTPNDIIQASDAGANLRSGYHTIGLLWESNRLVWYLNGTKMQEDRVRVPTVPHYMILSREMNSGVQKGDAKPPFMPASPGMHNANVWSHRANVNSDRALIDYIRIWDVS